MSRRHRPVYRDGKVHVRKRQCDTCIGFPDNRMMLDPGRVESMLATCQTKDTVIPCHEFMDTKAPAVCRWLWNQREVGDGIAVLQIAERLKVVAFDE